MVAVELHPRCFSGAFKDARLMVAPWQSVSVPWKVSEPKNVCNIEQTIMRYLTQAEGSLPFG
jgi:hypothetical protein